MQRASIGNKTIVLDYSEGTRTVWIKRPNTWRTDRTCSDFRGAQLGSAEGATWRGRCCQVSF